MPAANPFEHNTHERFPLDPNSPQMQWNMTCQDKMSNGGTCMGSCQLCIDRSELLPQEKFEANQLHVTNTFRTALSAIKNKNIYRWVIDTMARAPEYFWTVPASSTGKYHPPSDLGEGGLMRHTMNVAEVAMIMLDHPMSNFKDIQKDCIIAAAILHDSVKHGIPKQKWTQKDHPLLPELLDPTITKEEIINRSSLRGRIFRMIRSHMGPWNCEGMLPLPETEEERFLHFCDYISARRNVHITHDNR